MERGPAGRRNCHGTGARYDVAIRGRRSKRQLRTAVHESGALEDLAPAGCPGANGTVVRVARPVVRRGPQLGRVGAQLVIAARRTDVRSTGNRTSGDRVCGGRYGDGVEARDSIALTDEMQKP